MKQPDRASPLPAADVETASEDYARRFAGPVGEFFLATQTRLTLELLEPWPGATVLDVGGGHAQLAPALVERGFRVTVTGTAEICRARLDRALAPGTFAFRRADSLELPWEPRSFDVAMCFRLVPHEERWPELLAELCRVARHAVVIDYPDRRSFNAVQSPFFAWKKSVERNTRPFRCFSRSEITGVLARHGFGTVSLRPEFFLPMVVHRRVGRRALSELAEGVSARIGLTRAFGSPIVLRAERSDALSSPTR